MKPNESSSYNDNREYFQILKRQRKDFLRKILWKCDNGPCKIDTTLRTPVEIQESGEGTTWIYPTFSEGEEEQGWTRKFQVQFSVPGNVVRRIYSTEVHGRISARRNGMENLSQKMDEILKILPNLQKGLTELKTEVADLKKNQRDSPEISKSRQERIRDALGTVPLLHQKGKATEVPKPKTRERRERGITELVNVQTNEITPALPPPEGSTGRNLRRVPEHTPWARTMLQPLHPYGTILNLDIIDFRNTEKLIDEWVAALKIAATTLELDRENFIRLVELSLEGSVKIGWDNPPEDTKANILAGDSKSAIAERLGRLIKIHFIGDGYFEGSKTEKAREYAQALFGLELRSICAVDEYIYWFRKYFFQSGVATEIAAPNVLCKDLQSMEENVDPVIQSHISPDCPQKRGGLRKFEATNDILDAVYYGNLVPVYQFEDIPSDESVYEEEIETDSDGSSTESEIGGIGRFLNQIGVNQRRHHIIYKVSLGDFAIPMELTGNVMKMQLIPKEEILEELSKLREEVAVTMKWIHIGAIEVVVKATFKEGIDSEIHLSIMDRRINNLRDGCLGTMIENMKEYIEIPRIFKEFAKVMTPDPIKIPRIGGVDLVIKDHPILEQTLSTRTEFSSRMSFLEDRIVGYRGKEKELIKTFTPQEIRVDNVKLRRPGGWKEMQVVFDITERDNHFPCDDLYHLQQPVIGRYEGMLEIAGHEILVAGVAGKENGSMTWG
ncbi:UNVERIFIED_CONTAM: movement protein [Sesamum latifolium]|uniref:Movement protein n=1 Tax=Sesamum latifolium TaxID=2727402 RepID=A0AAW2VXU8_9LAMI